MYNYLKDPELIQHYIFKLYDVVCKYCYMCNSGSHDWNKIPHTARCHNPNRFKDLEDINASL